MCNLLLRVLVVTMSTKNSGGYLESQNRALIQIVKSNDWIYSKDQRYTYNEERRAALWQQISMTLSEKEFPLLDPKTRWKQLRDQFTRHDRNGNDNWLYYTEMNFMLPHICHKVKAPASLPQWPVQNQSSSATTQLDMQGLGNRDSNVEPFCEELRVLAIASSVHPVENAVQLVEETVDHTQIPSSNPTLETYSQELNWEHTYAISPISSSAASETLTVSSPPPPDYTTKENCTYRVADKIEAPVPSTSRNSILRMDYAETRTTPTNTCRKQIANSTSICTPRAEKSSNRIELSGSLSTSKRASPLVTTPMSHIHDTNNMHLVTEPSRVPTRSATPKTSKGDQKRPIVVPPMDAFAKKKKKQAGKTDTTDDAIIGCSEDLREMSSEFKDLLRMKKELIKAQLQEGRGEAETSKNSHMVRSEDGFFNLLQEEWLDLPIAVQDELFPEILNVMEEFEVS